MLGLCQSQLIQCGKTDAWTKDTTEISFHLTDNINTRTTKSNFRQYFIIMTTRTKVSF
jgi:hypothetical protein